MAIREMVNIDEDKCDGCGLCVPSCAEGAIQIIAGKARLVADNLKRLSHRRDCRRPAWLCQQ